MEITHVIRGDDHISNTPRQLLLYRAFGWDPPHMAHVPMILGADGSRLSKRHGATAVGSYRELGFIPEAMVNFLVLLGWSFDGQREMFTLAELESLFRIDRVGGNPAVFDLVKLEWMNGQHLKRLPEEERVARTVAFLESRGWDLSQRTPEWRTILVRAIGDRLKTLVDAERYGAFALQDLLEIDPESWNALLQKPQVAARLIALAERVAADAEFSLASLETLLRGLASEHRIKAGELIGVARIALTGRTVSPGIFEVMWLLGRERTVARLHAAAARWQAEAPVAS
jgi:glutamyl/glutaminyl-tRNA synthetase